MSIMNAQGPRLSPATGLEPVEAPGKIVYSRLNVREEIVNYYSAVLFIGREEALGIYPPRQSSAGISVTYRA